MTNKNITLELISLFIVLIVSFLLWDTYLLYPIKLFVILIHEISHGFCAVLSGGKIITLNIGLDLSGRCETEGGNNILMATAGYLGSFLLGTLIFYSTHNKKIGKWLLIIISLFILIPSLITIQNILIIVFAIVLSLLIFASSFFLRNYFISFIIKAFGILSCVYVLFDIKEDIFSNTTAISDAAILSDLINVPVVIIGIAWLLISVVGIILLMKISYFRNSK